METGIEMELFLHVLVVLEMLIVNLTTVNLSCKRKYSRSKTLLILTGCAAVVISVSLFLLTKTSTYGNGNGLFALIGFVFLLPLKLLYRNSLQRIIEVICSSWIYTMLVFVLAVHSAKLFDPSLFSLLALLIQTGLYLLTMFPFWRFMKQKFVYVLTNIPPKTNKFLQALSLMWFATVIVINLALVYTDRSSLKFLSLLLLGADAFLSYLLLHTIVRNLKSIEHLETIVYIDSLTGLRNRSSLLLDANEWLRQQEPFFLIFMDLDRFKSINDRFGHLEGDAYLKRFADSMRGLLRESDILYRISGDEFICLCRGQNPLGLIERIRANSWEYTPENPFLGVSVGFASYPEDACTLGELIAAADGRMYAQKREKDTCNGTPADL